MASSKWLSLLILLPMAFSARSPSGDARTNLSPIISRKTEDVGTRWAVLVAGSRGYSNYRHQSDVCHAYHVLRKGGLKDENIVVFMYDDVADDTRNLFPGTIINSPKGENVYAGVPKDYTGDAVTAGNLFAVLLGKHNELVGGSGKVLHSGPNDHIFVHYSDHGGPGVLGMPTSPFVYASDFVKLLKAMHKTQRYKEMVIYVEACNSGSLFDGMLPNDLNIYVTTASRPDEDSYATYCPGDDPSLPIGLDTCLGDLYSVSWMEHSESHDRRMETINTQFKVVRVRTNGSDADSHGSHVMAYGDESITDEKLYVFQGFDDSIVEMIDNVPPPLGATTINQRDADLLYMWRRYDKMDGNSLTKKEIGKEIIDIEKHRQHLDHSINLLGKLLFGAEHGSSILAAVRPSGQPLVDDWNCLKSMVRVFESHCGTLTQYGMKHMRAFANACNMGVPKASMEEACISVCQTYNSTKWNPLIRGYSA